MSSELNEGIERVLDREIVNRHSYFQLKYFVVNKEPTHQSKMWRCVKELQARVESLEAMRVEIENGEDDSILCLIEVERLELTKKTIMERLEVSLGINPGISKKGISPESQNLVAIIQLEEKELNIKIKKAERKVKSVEKHLNTLRNRLKEVEEEATFFVKSFHVLETVESLKPFDDLQSQEAYWNEKFAEELNLRALLGQPPSFELVKSILSLNNEAPIKKQIVNTLEKKQELLLDLAKKENNGN